MSSRRNQVPQRGPLRRALLRQDVLGVDNDTALSLLTEATAERRAALDAETRLLAVASRWALLHLATEDQAGGLPGSEGAVEVAGEGAPLVAEFCFAELGAAMGMSTHTARNLVGDAVELAHRLPQTWSRLCAGQVEPWRARRIANKTWTLSAQAAAHVDEVVHGVANSIGLAALEQLITETVARFDPARAAAEAAAAAEKRGVQIDVRQPLAGDTGPLGYVDAVVDPATAKELATAVAEIAHELLALHPEESLDVRRALALGYLARGQAVPTPAALDTTSVEPVETPARPRTAVLHLHLSESAVRGTGGLARLEEGRLVVDADQVRAWLDTPHAKVVVKPVLDLAEQLHTDAYEIPDRLRDQAILRDVTCVFPWCARNARDGDVDHVIPFEDGGPTATDDLACLCRRHHRAKTHSRWSYVVIEPGRYLWTSPHGLRFLRDHRGTRQVE